MPQGPFIRRRGRSTTIVFQLFEVDGVDFRVDAVHASGDTKLMKDEGAEANTGSGFVDEGQGYSIALTDTEMQAARNVVYVVDQTATKVWLDTALVIETVEPPGLLQASDIATLASQTSFTLAEGSADNDAYNNCTAVITDATTLEQKAHAPISNYVGSTKTVTLAADPGIFTIAAGDYIDILATSAQANVAAISGDATAADNLELQYDTTGLAGDTFPATQSQLAGLTNTGSAVNRAPASYVLTTGTQSANTVSSTAALDGTRHEHTDTAGAMELYYEFLIGSGLPSSVTMTGFLNGNNDNLEIHGFDWVASAFVQIGTLSGKNASTNEVNSFDLFTDMVGTGSDFGKVRVQFIDGAFTLTSATLAVDQIFVSFSQQAGGYDDGAVWIDTTLSNTNTVSGVDGISTNPVSTIAAANTLATNLNLRKFHVAPNSSITFAASQENQEFDGLNWTLALGGQSISNSHITGADVSGTMTASTEAHFDHCEMDDCTLGSCHIDESDIAGDLTFSAAATYNILGCYHSKATSPVIDFGAAVGNTTLHVHDYHGAMTIANMGQSGTDVLHFSSSNGKLTMNSNNIGGTKNLNGTFALADSSTGQTTNDDGHVPNLVWDEAMVETTGAPAITGSFRLFHQWWAALSRNKVTQTSTTTTLRNDADGADLATSAVSDDATTFTRDEWST